MHPIQLLVRFLNSTFDTVYFLCHSLIVFNTKIRSSGVTLLRCLCVIFITLSLPLLAVTVNVPSLNTPEHLDLEVNKCVPIPESCYTGLRILIIDIRFENASTSNGFYVAFGNDTGNEYLEFEEMQFQIGFESGRWQIRDRGMLNTYVCTNQFAQTNTTSLKMWIRVNEDAIPSKVTFADSGRPFSFPGLDLSTPEIIPEWLIPAFSDLKVTRRGYFASEPEDSISVAFSQDGVRVLIR
jgi:hypothetical protein